MLVQLYKGGIDNYGFRICIYGQHAKDVIPDLQSGPFEEAFMYCVPRPKLRMQVPPRCACFHNPQDSIKCQAVVFTFASSGFSTGLRQHRPDYGPLFVGNVVSAHGKTKAADRRKVEILFRNSPSGSLFFRRSRNAQGGNLEDIFLWRDGMAERGEARLAMRSALQQDAVWKGKP